MKKITIYQENNKEIELLDDDSEDINSYTIEISKLLNNTTNVFIIETTSKKNLILKPSTIKSILVEELDFSNNKNEKSTIIKKEIVNKKDDDIIKD